MNSSQHFRGFKRSLTYLLAASQLSLLALIPAYASDNQVRIAGNSIFSVKGDSASDKAVKIQHNIDNSLVASSNHGPSAVKITYVKGLPVITLGGYYVATVDNATAKSFATTPAILAQKWASSMKSALANKTSVDAYISQLTGKLSDPVSTPIASSSSASAQKAKTVSTAAPAKSNYSAPSSTAYDTSADSQSSGSGIGWQSMPSSNTGSGTSQPAYSAHAPITGRVAYIPAGMMIPVKLQTSISSSVAKSGDVVVATTAEDINLGSSVIPANTTLTGHITEAADGAWMGRSGSISIKFTSMRSAYGVETPITAHISGNVGKYEDKGNSTFRGETNSTKIKKAAIATGVGAGLGTVTGIAIGAIAAGGHGVGRGALTGAAIGGGLGLAQTFLLRKGSEVNLTQGQTFNLQLDAPVTVAMN